MADAPRTVTLPIRSVVAVLAIVALAGIGYFIWALNDNVNELSDRQSALEVQQAAAITELTAEQQDLRTELSAVSGGGEEVIAPLQRRMALFAECVAELQAEVDSLEVDFGFVFVQNQPSAKCQRFLRGEQASGD